MWRGKVIADYLLCGGCECGGGERDGKLRVLRSEGEKEEIKHNGKEMGIVRFSGNDVRAKTMSDWKKSLRRASTSCCSSLKRVNNVKRNEWLQYMTWKPSHLPRQPPSVHPGPRASR